MSSQPAITLEESVLPSLMTVEQVAELLAVASRTVWRLNSKGAIPKPIKFGGNVRWRGGDLQKWLNEGCPKAESRDHRSSQ